ncbi:phosphoribosyltransferase domain-containing protein [Azotobacter armeniacus]
MPFKRALLFVSCVLGRHIPARPSAVSASFDELAANIPDDLPDPVLTRLTWSTLATPWEPNCSQSAARERGGPEQCSPDPR